MAREVIIHMINDHLFGIEGIVGNITFFPPPRIAGPGQDAFVETTLSWNRDQNQCGPFKFNIGPFPDGAIKHFDLILHHDIPLPIPGIIARIFPNQVGLRPCQGNGSLPDTIWAEYGDPCYVTGTGTPYVTATKGG